MDFLAHRLCRTDILEFIGENEGPDGRQGKGVEAGDSVLEG